MLSSTASASSKNAAANASECDDAQMKISKGKASTRAVAAAARGGSAAEASQEHDAAMLPGEAVANKQGNGVGMDDSSKEDGNESGASSQKQEGTAAAEKGSSDSTLELDRLTRLALVVSRVEDPFFCEGKV